MKTLLFKLTASDNARSYSGNSNSQLIFFCNYILIVYVYSSRPRREMLLLYFVNIIEIFNCDIFVQSVQ